MYDGINRNIVECKDNTCIRNRKRRFVLIETLWNVKITTAINIIIKIMVLIETLWNVKTIDVFNLLEEAFRINRNIVECKEKSTSRDLWVFFYVLIETLWNVKLICL